MIARRVVAAIAVVGLGGVARAVPPPVPGAVPATFGTIASAMGAWAKTAVARAHAAATPVPPVAPVPVAVHWKPQRIGTLDLGSPLVALAAADLDGDGKGELYAVTARDVVAIGLGGKVHELGRVPFVGDPALVTPRDVVGSAARDGDAIVASVSGFARGLRVHWRAGALVGDAAAPGFVLCAGESATLSPGKNFFGDGATAIYAAQCRANLVDPAGHALHVRGTVSLANKLDVIVERCDPTCAESARFEVPAVGVAFELADLDRDGHPEAIVSGAGAPGDSDAVKIVTLGVDKPLYRHAFAGGVAGVVAIETATGPQVIAAVRLAGATRVDLWRLN